MEEERLKKSVGILSKIQPEKNKDFNDITFADTYSKLYIDILKYNADMHDWYYFDTVRWIKDSSGLVAQALAKDMFDVFKVYSYSIKDAKAYKDFSDYWSKLGTYNKRASVILDARSYMKVYQKDFDNKPNLFNCANCTIDLDSFTTHTHNPKDMITKVSGCNYDPNVDGSIFNNFISQIMQGNVEKTLYLQRVVGSVLSPTVVIEKVFFIYGRTTRNGKTTFCETFRIVMGEYASSIPPEALAFDKNRSGSSASPFYAELPGKRFVTVNEPPKRLTLDVAQMKSITGGDTISARMLYKDPISFKAQFKLFVNCNYLPVVNDNTIFDSDRIRVIPFDLHLEPEQQNTSLKQTLCEPENLSAALNWALEGYRSIRSIGECPPECVLKASTEYKELSDRIQSFFNDCMVQSRENSNGSSVYETYCMWSSENGFSSMGKQSFFKELRARGLMKSATVENLTDRNAVVGYTISNKYVVA